MLTSTVTTISSTAAGAMTTQMGLPEYGVLVVIALITLLSAKEILSASEKWNKSLNASLNLAIVPLLVAFVAIVAFKVTEIL